VVVVRSDGGDSGVVGSVLMWCYGVNEKALEPEEAQGLRAALRAVYGAPSFKEEAGVI
jgi:hypothetical protein